MCSAGSRSCPGGARRPATPYTSPGCRAWPGWLRERHLPAHISSPEMPDLDVADEGFRLRRGRVISSASSTHRRLPFLSLPPLRACRRPTLGSTMTGPQRRPQARALSLGRAGDNGTYATRWAACARMFWDARSGTPGRRSDLSQSRRSVELTWVRSAWPPPPHPGGLLKRSRSGPGSATLCCAALRIEYSVRGEGTWLPSPCAT